MGSCPPKIIHCITIGMISWKHKLDHPTVLCLNLSVTPLQSSCLGVPAWPGLYFPLQWVPGPHTALYSPGLPIPTGSPSPEALPVHMLCCWPEQQPISLHFQTRLTLTFSVPSLVFASSGKPSRTKSNVPILHSPDTNCPSFKIVTFRL